MTTLARVVFLALVAATFGAFFVAQRLKGSPPVVQLHGQRWFSPSSRVSWSSRRTSAMSSRRATVRACARAPERVP